MIDPQAIKFRVSDPRSKLALLEKMPELSPLIAELLVGRGYGEPSQVERFLSPSLEDLHDPFLLRDMEVAVNLVRQSMQEGLRILIHGDYDCDGICATTLLLDGLTELGADVDYHIPDRFEEGYGLSMKAVERCAAEGFGLLLSVDCGSSSHAEIEAAQKMGVRVIITDHHQVPTPAPRPDALVNPQHPDDRYPFKGLCGTGVAFKLLQSLRQEKGDQPRHLLDLVALATIADVVPLVEENRVLVQRGLLALSQTDRIGLRALLEAAGRDLNDPVDAFTVAFTVAPRLNASGRLEHAKAGVELLRCRSRSEAISMAAHLQSLNEERKECEQRIGREIEERLMAEPERWQGGAIVEYGHGWHEGVIGITAGRLAERYGVPALVIAVDQKGGAKGSGRSPENVDLFATLQRCAPLFRKFGGHPRAAGFSLDAEHLGDLREQFTAAANALRDGLAPVWVDASLGLAQLNLDLVKLLQRLEPYGEANPKPMFLLEGVTVVGHRTVGKNRDHLQLELEQSGVRQRAIAFRQGDQIDVLETQNFRYDLLCQIGQEVFRGQNQLRLQVSGIVRPQRRDPRGDVIVDRRNSRARRGELEAWLGSNEGYLAVCRDTAKAIQLYPIYANRFVRYADLKAPRPGLVLLTPPTSDEELCRALELSRPSRVVVLFGRQELDVLERATSNGLWGREQAIAVWRELKRTGRQSFVPASIIRLVSQALNLSTDSAKEILEAFLETGALRAESSELWSLAQGSGRKLESTAPFQAMLSRRQSHLRLMRMFTGPMLTQSWLERFDWLQLCKATEVDSLECEILSTAAL